MKEKDIINDPPSELSEIPTPRGDVLGSEGHMEEREGIISELKRLAGDLGKTPTFKQLSDRMRIDTRTFFRIFRSYNDAVRAAGLEPNRQVRRKRE